MCVIFSFCKTTSDFAFFGSVGTSLHETILTLKTPGKRAEMLLLVHTGERSPSNQILRGGGNTYIDWNRAHYSKICHLGKLNVLSWMDLRTFPTLLP